MPNKKKETIEVPKKIEPKKIEKKKIVKRLVGVATRNSLSNTVPVQIDLVRVHPLYLKRYNRSKKILAHTEGEVKKGQKVIIEETKPLSKNKAWKVVN